MVDYDIIVSSIIKLMDSIKWDSAGQDGAIKGEDVPEVLEELWYKVKHGK